MAGYHPAMRWTVSLSEDEPMGVPDSAESPSPGTGRFHALMVPEGVWSGDGRQFTADSLSWRDLPLPAMAQDVNLPAHMEAVLVGNFDRIERRGTEVHGWGAFLSEPDEEAAVLIGLIQRGELRGFSVDVDAVEFELLLPEGDGDEEALLLADGSADDAAEPEGIPIEMPRMRVTQGRIMGGTVVPFPAFMEAFIEPDGEGASLVAAAVPPHKTGMDDSGSWDASAEEGRLPDPMPLDVARSFYGWIDEEAVVDGAVPASAGLLPHHVVSDDGVPGDASMEACAAAIETLGGDSGLDAGEVEAVYAHIAQHYTDNDLDAPSLPGGDESGEGGEEGAEATSESSASVLVAAIVIPDEPPRSWFDEPHHDRLSPVRVSDRGRVSGHLAAWDSCHIGMLEAGCTAPPRTKSGYAHFHTGEVRCLGGERVAVGHISCRGGHASTALSAPEAQAFYDDTDSVVADVRVGEDRFGIWVAGALRPGCSPAEVRVTMASDVSGDWRWIGGALELIHVTSVNVPGFHKRAYVRQDHGMVAALVAPLDNDDSLLRERLAERIAFSIGRDRRSRLHELVARVHPEAVQV